jgi:hypothetical protein
MREMIAKVRFALGRNARFVVDDGVCASTCESSRFEVASACKGRSYFHSERERYGCPERFTSRLGFVRLFAQTLFQVAQIIPHFRYKRPKYLLPPSACRGFGIGKMLFTNHDEPVMFLRVVEGRFSRHGVGSALDQSHLGVLALLVVNFVLVLEYAEFGRTWHKEHMHVFDIIKRVGFFVLNAGTVKEIDVAPLNGS